VNGAARPFEHCSKQSSDSPMPPQQTLSVIAMCVINPDHSPARIRG
jgi:hypothetical protein